MDSDPRRYLAGLVVLEMSDVDERIASKPLTPDDRARMPHPQGFPVILSDGQTWVLAHGCLKPRLLRETDEIFDDVMVTQIIPLPAAMRAAFILLMANYDVSQEEAYQLLQTAELRQLVTAVADSLLGPDRGHKTWSMWALSAFYSNGIEPMSVPPQLVPSVLLQLVKTGRAMGQTDFIDSAAAGAMRAQLLNTLPPQKPPPAPKPPAQDIDQPPSE